MTAPATTGLTPFILKMLAADPQAIARARRNPGKLAARYAIPEPTAAGYLRLHIVQGETR